MFPQFLGIHKLNGLIAKDRQSGKTYSLSEFDSDISFEVLHNNKSDPFEQAPDSKGYSQQSSLPDSFPDQYNFESNKEALDPPDENEEADLLDLDEPTKEDMLGD